MQLVVNKKKPVKMPTIEISKILLSQCKWLMPGILTLGHVKTYSEFQDTE